MIEETPQFDEVSSVVMEGFTNTTYLSDKVQENEFESFQSNIHVQEEVNDVDKEKAVKETNGTPIVFRSLMPHYEDATIKPR